MVTLMLHKKGDLDLTDLNYNNRKLKNPYADSKLAMLYFARELSVKTHGSNVKVYSLCPGWVLTNLFRHNLKNVLKIIFALPIAFLFMRNVVQGAQTSIYCSTEPSLVDESGFFYRDCARFISKHKFDDEVGKKLWKLSEKIIEDKGATI